MEARVPKIAWSFIDEQEGDVLKSYWDGTGWACGRGIHGDDIGAHTVWTQAESNQRFREKLESIARNICPRITPELSDGQLTACESLAYNIGAGKFNTSTLLAELNDGQTLEAANQFLLWCHKEVNGVEIVDKALLDRRRKERALFLSRKAMPDVQGGTQEGSGNKAQVPVRVGLGMSIFHPIAFVERKVVMAWLKKHWGTISAVAGPLLVFLEPSLHAYMVAHPHQILAVVMGALLTLYHSRAPKDK